MLETINKKIRSIRRLCNDNTDERIILHPPAGWKEILQVGRHVRNKEKFLSKYLEDHHVKHHNNKKEDFIDWKHDDFENGRTILIRALEIERFDICRLLLLEQYGANVNIPDKDGLTAIMIAARAGYKDTVQLLMDHGADSKAANQKNGMTVLMYAAQGGCNKIVEMFLEDKSTNVDIADQNGETALVHAARAGHVDTVTLLVDHGADIFAIEDTAEKSSLLLNAAEGGYTEIVQLLLSLLDKDDEGHDFVNLANENGETPLLKACWKGKTGIVNQLLQSGALVNTADRHGWTPLMNACHYRYIGVVRLLLLVGGVDMTMVNDLGDTAWSLALNRQEIEILKLLVSAMCPSDDIPVDWVLLIADVHNRDLGGVDLEEFCTRWMKHPNKATFVDWKSELVSDGRTMLHWSIRCRRWDLAKVLLENGANANVADNDGNTPLMEASLKGHIDTVDALLAKNANANIADKDGYSLLMRAVFRGHTEVAKLLLDRGGADIHAKDPGGSTPLHIVCNMGRNMDTIKLLLERGADSEIKDNLGMTPLHWACLRGYLEVVQTLLGLGVNPSTTKTPQGKTALQVASERNQFDIVWFLVRQYPTLMILDELEQ